MPKKRIEQWVEIPVKFFISADDHAAYKKALATLPAQVWHAVSSSDGYHIASEAAQREE